MPKPKLKTPPPITVIDKGKRITGEDREKLKEQLRFRYEGGATIRELHEETGRSFGAIQRLLTEAGVTMRPRGGARVAS